MKPVISSENVVWLLSQDPTATLAEMTGGVKMSNTVQELRTNKVLKVEGMTDRGRLRCREVQFSRTGRMMKKGKRFLHQADEAII